MTDSAAVIVFVVKQPPLPPMSGAAIRSHRLLTGLANAFPVTLVTYAHQRGAVGHVDVEEVRAALPGVDVIMVPGLAPGKRGAQLASLPGARSWQWGRYAREALGAALRRTVVDRQAGLVHFDDLGVAAFAPIGDTVNVFAPHNIEHRILRGVADATTGPRSAFANLESRKIKREEGRVWRTVPLCLAVSDVDAAAMHRGGARHVALCPNGTDPVARLPVPRRHGNEPFRMLFVGTASYPPYERGLAWFVTEVLPLVREVCPATLDVVGAPPPRPRRAPGVEYHGTVPSVAEWYERAHAVVVPVFEGSGTRLKIVEAMAYGRPVVSTALGSEGLPIEPGVHYVTSEVPDGFARALCDLAIQCSTGDQTLEQMVTAASKAVSHLMWPRIVDDLIELYAQRLGTGPAMC